MKLNIALLISFIAAVVANPAIPRDPALEARVSQPRCTTEFVCSGGAAEVSHCQALGYTCEIGSGSGDPSCEADCTCILAPPCGRSDEA
ncbi:hypothetical protein B0H19DRAFT_1123872 [Mycena capillaripes]|nr:hypothetical protein B0H19DRAFT_1123872 [Mycena capillaripes]